MPDPGYEILADLDLCTGTGLCVVMAGATFDVDDDAKVVVVDAEGDPLDAIRGAVAACPNHALRLEEGPTE